LSLVQGDGDLIWMLFAYRYATASQIARRFGRSPPVVRRAVRLRLQPGGFVEYIHRKVSQEAAFTLGREGLTFVAEHLKCPVSDLSFPKTSATRGFFWDHSMAINEVRLSFDLATQEARSPIVIHRTIGEWELNPARRGAPLLFERFKGPDGDAIFRPDCLFLMHPKAAGVSQMVAVFLELDRASESIANRIRAKYEGFYQYFVRRRFVDAFGVDVVAMRVLFVLDNVTDRQRLQNMQAELRKFTRAKGTGAEPFERCFRFALMRDLNEATVITQRIWSDAHDVPRLFFFQPVHQPPSPDEGAAERSDVASPSGQGAIP
jgi:hypothetical protein